MYDGTKHRRKIRIQKVFRFPGLPLQQMKMMVFMWWKKEIPLQLSVKKCMEMLIM